MNTNQLPIRTELEQDRSGEAVENFMICLPNAQVLLSVGAVAVEPLCVTITIVDDDCKAITSYYDCEVNNIIMIIIVTYYA